MATLNELYDAVEAGKEVVVKVDAETTVIIRTTNKDTAKNIVQALAPAPPLGDDVKQALFTQVDGFLAIAEEEWPDEVRAFLKAQVEHYAK